MAKAKPRTVQREIGHVSGPLQGMLSKAHLRSEGHPLELIRESGVLSSDTARLGLDLSTAPVPQRRYAADICAVTFTKNEAKIIFAQCCLMGESLDSALVIRMSPHAIKMLAESLRGIDDPSVQALAETMGIVTEELSKITSKPTQTANMVANICSVAVSGHETCLDFYHASAFAAKKSESTGALEVESVVRVDLRTALFLPLIARIFELDQEIGTLTNRGTA
jgi:hypothetical protein